MKKIICTISAAVFLSLPVLAQTYHSVAAFSYTAEGLYAKVIKANPTNPKVVYMGAQNVNSSYKGFFDTYDLTNPDSIKRTTRMGIQTDSFGVTDFVFRGTDIYAIGSKGLQIINAGNPANPVLTKNIRTVKDGALTKTIGYFTASILVDGNRMHYGGSNYYLIDISNLNAPEKIAERSYSGINSGSIVSLGTNKVLVGDGYDLNIFDVTSPPTVTKTTLNTLYGDPQQMCYDAPKQILYTTFETSSKCFVYSVNMSNNAKLDSFNYLSVAGFDPSSHSGLFLYKDTLYVGTSQGIALFDVSTPSDLRFLGKLPTGGSNAVYVNDEYLITNDHYTVRFYRRGPAPLTSAHEQVALSTIELFPNPAQHSVYLILAHPSQPAIELIDASGKSIKSWSAASDAVRHEIPIQDVKPGVYLMRIRSGGQWASRKLVVE